MLLKPLALYRIVAVFTAGALLSACATFVPSTGQAKSESETVTLNCYWRFQLQAIDECHVSSVDGQRPGASQFASLKTELAPGRRWVELKMQHTVGFGGTMDVCAFEHDFVAGHHYRILPQSSSAGGRRPRKDAGFTRVRSTSKRRGPTAQRPSTVLHSHAAVADLYAERLQIAFPILMSFASRSRIMHTENAGSSVRRRQETGQNIRSCMRG